VDGAFACVSTDGGVVHALRTRGGVGGALPQPLPPSPHACLRMLDKCFGVHCGRGLALSPTVHNRSPVGLTDWLTSSTAAAARTTLGAIGATGAASLTPSSFATTCTHTHARMHASDLGCSRRAMATTGPPGPPSSQRAGAATMDVMSTYPGQAGRQELALSSAALAHVCLLLMRHP
jgi:hypothetical protein